VEKDNLPELKMRIGIHHGPMVVASFGSKERSDDTAIGPTANMPSRVEDERMLYRLCKTD